MADTYTTGTITVGAGGSPIVGSGTAWASIIYRGDMLVHNASGVACLVDTITDDTHIVPFGSHWLGGAVSGAAYTIYKNSPLRFNGASAMQVVIDAWEMLQETGVIYAVVGVGVLPDVGIGSNGQYAINLDDSPWSFFKKVAGVWVAQSQFFGIGWGVHGADIASAATIDLETATGELVDVTGTTTITAITLSNGHERTVRFTGSLTLTHGSSLVLPGGLSKQTQAGDFAVFRGYAAGVVRCVLYTNNGAWTTYSPTITSGSGSITTLGTVTAAYRVIGKTVFLRVSIAITTNGTAAADIRFTLPTGIVPFVNGSAAGFGSNLITGKQLKMDVYTGSPGFGLLLYYDGTYPAANGSVLNVVAVFEMA